MPTGTCKPAVTDFSEGLGPMSSYVYCLYSTEDGVPRYVGRASDKVSYRFKQHVTAALEKELGALYDWMRDVWRSDFDVLVHTLQEGVIPRDEAFYEQYWIDQFPTLLNQAGNRPGKEVSPVALQVIAALKAQIALAKQQGN
jgi:hypothetical protein